MASSREAKRDRLWNGLPAVFYNKKYIVYSPYAQKILILTASQLTSSSTLKNLSLLGFFGKPEKREEDRLSVTLYLTSSCNLKCIYCFDSTKEANCQSTCSKQSNERMSPNFAISILKQIISNKPLFKASNGLPRLNIHFFGGEPTLNFQTIKAVVDFLEKNKIDAKYNISTNLIASKKVIEWLISKDFRFDISCDGRPEIHDKQRPLKAKSNIKSSDIVEENIKLLTAKKARIRTKAVVTNETIKEMPNTVKYLASLGVDHIRQEAVLLDGRYKKMKPLNVNKFVKYYLKAAGTAAAIGKRTGRAIYISNWATKNLFTPRDHFCSVLRGNRLLVMPDGSIIKCIRNMHGKESPFSIGKASEKGLFINKGKMSALQSLTVEKIPKCSNCFAKYICGGGCFNENRQMNGSFFKPWKVKCDLAKMLVRELIIKMHNLEPQEDMKNPASSRFHYPPKPFPFHP